MTTLEAAWAYARDEDHTRNACFDVRDAFLAGAQFADERLKRIEAAVTNLLASCNHIRGPSQAALADLRAAMEQPK